MVRSLEGKHPLYFEAILQLREVTDDVINFVRGELSRNSIHVAKVAKVKNGLDFYIADNQFTKSLGKKLQQRFGGQVLSTASLHTQKKGKELYRTTILFRGLPFTKGRRVIYKGEEYLIKAMGHDIFLTGMKKVHVRYKDAQDIKPMEDVEDIGDVER